MCGHVLAAQSGAAVSTEHDTCGGACVRGTWMCDLRHAPVGAGHWWCGALHTAPPRDGTASPDAQHQLLGHDDEAAAGGEDGGAPLHGAARSLLVQLMRVVALRLVDGGSSAEQRAVRRAFDEVTATRRGGFGQCLRWCVALRGAGWAVRKRVMPRCSGQGVHTHCVVGCGWLRTHGAAHVAAQRGGVPRTAGDDAACAGAAAAA